MNYRIVCTDQVPIDKPLRHAHIVNVGVDTNNDGYADEKHSKQHVIDNIGRGHKYYTIGGTPQRTAYVEVVACPTHCGLYIIRSKPDATRANNLDSLRRCKWTQ